MYHDIQKVLREISGRKRVGLSDITVMGDDAAIVSSLRKAITTGNDISGIRFSRNVINGQYIEDAYIYRMT